jgi:AAA15 family ATPase/GTPase
MLSSLTINNFKCFYDSFIKFGKLTVLAGKNGTGKSTVIQALALMMQTIRHNETSKDLILNGDALQLGTFTEVVNSSSDRSRSGERYN